MCGNVKSFEVGLLVHPAVMFMNAMREYGKENTQFLPLACDSPRWNIEVSYYESKAFWSLEEYRVRSHEGIERSINLECMAYSAMTLLPYSDESFLRYQSASAQETCFSIGQEIHANMLTVLKNNNTLYLVKALS